MSLTRRRHNIGGPPMSPPQHGRATHVALGAPQQHGWAAHIAPTEPAAWMGQPCRPYRPPRRGSAVDASEVAAEQAVCQDCQTLMTRSGHGTQT
jgi:hypothetical protein